MSAKVADFGLSYEMPENSGKDGHVSRATSMIQKVAQPIWWMSPECIEKRFYDEKTDVWSFAVLMWEAEFKIIEMWTKDRNFYQRWNFLTNDRFFLPKIEIFNQRSKSLPKIEFFNR